MGTAKIHNFRTHVFPIITSKSVTILGSFQLKGSTKSKAELLLSTLLMSKALMSKNNFLKLEEKQKVSYKYLYTTHLFLAKKTMTESLNESDDKIEASERRLQPEHVMDFLKQAQYDKDFGNPDRIKFDFYPAVCLDFVNKLFILP